jgi:hypothetical protein
MSAILAGTRLRKEVVELMMVAIYLVLTILFFVCSSPPRIAVALRDAVTPFQITVRARKAGADRSIEVWRPSQFESRTPPLSR